jgi:ribosomal protein S18 acetylase RimI-like enzyme
MVMKIRVGTSDDIKEIDICNRAVLPENYDYDYYFGTFEKDHCCYVLVNDNNSKQNSNTDVDLGIDKVYGYILGYRETHDPSVMNLMSFGILPECQKQNWGKKLLQAFFEDIKTKNQNATNKDIVIIKNVGLSVRKTNKRAQKLYKKAKFGFVRNDKDYYGKGHDGLLMIKTFPSI